MCDERDKNQELLEKLSRQLSELTSSGSSPIDEVLLPAIGNQWVQPPGGPPREETHSSFSRLYTWDPDFLDTSPNRSHHLPNTHFPPPQDCPLGSSAPTPPASQQLQRNLSSWNTDSGLPSPHDFQRGHELNARFPSTSSSPASPADFGSLIGNPHYYQHHQEPLFQSNTPIIGRSFVPSQPKEELFSSLPSVVGNHSPTLNNHHQNFNVQTSPVSGHPILGDGIDCFYNTNNSSDLLGEGAYFDTPTPAFDPSTPPPPFLFQRHLSQLSDSSDQPTDSLAAPNEFLDFLRRQAESPINLDLDANIGGSDNWETYPEEKENVSTSDEGKQLYAEALSKWNSFDFSGIDSATTSEELSLLEASNKESQVESAGQDVGKPSYSDIAKTPKLTPSPSLKAEQASSSTAAKTSLPSKSGKPYRPLIQRTISASKFWPKGNSSGPIDQPKVSPTSRYGLDSFDDVHSVGSASKHSEGLESVQSKSRGSSTSLLNEEMISQNNTRQGKDNMQAPEIKFMNKQEEDTNFGDTQSRVGKTSSVRTPPKSPTISKSEERLFFDPKRIFQSKNTNKSRAQSPNQKTVITAKPTVKDEISSGETILNNGKPMSSSPSFKLPTAARQHDYINNDLRDTNKDTNKTAAESAHSPVVEKNEDLQNKRKEPLKPPGVGKRSGRTNGSFHREKRKAFEDYDSGSGYGFLPSNANREKLVEWLSVKKEAFTHWGKVMLSHVVSFLFCALVFLFGLIYYLSCGAYDLLRFFVGKAWSVIVTRIRARRGKTPDDHPSWGPREPPRRRLGLEENITLPSTGEEAMKRLLACKGKDSYSILGLRQDSTDEEIKKYYKKQAVLVHPDKNQMPGAEEAFKILGHSFDKIGEPSKRKEYDSQALFESESELRQEFADLITKLQTKIQEAANMIPCDNCGSRHRRVPVDRPVHNSRYCEDHKIRHPSKEGDVWAESIMLGFYWNYYAVMEGRVYDITDWVKCHGELYSKIVANDHRVGFKIAVMGNKKPRHQPSNANLEDLINRIFPQTPPGYPGGGGGGPGHGTSPGTHRHTHPSHGTGEAGAWGHGGSHHTTSSTTGASTATNKKGGGGGGGRRKKKRH